MVINHDVVSHRRKKLNQEKHVTHVLKSLPIFILSIYENLQISLVWYCQSVSPSVRQSVSPSASTVRYRQSVSQYSTIPPVRQSVQYDTASPSVSTVWHMERNLSCCKHSYQSFIITTSLRMKWSVQQNSVCISKFQQQYCHIEVLIYLRSK